MYETLERIVPGEIPYIYRTISTQNGKRIMAVYILVDENDKCLYVGCSYYPGDRLGAHLKKKIISPIHALIILGWAERRFAMWMEAHKTVEFWSRGEAQFNKATSLGPVRKKSEVFC